MEKFTEEEQSEAVTEDYTICNFDGFDELTQEQRIKSLDGAINRLNFERRFVGLTESQLNHMSTGNLSEAQRERLGNCKNDKDRDDVFEEYSRADFFKQCAWGDYLNGVTDIIPLVDPKQL